VPILAIIVTQAAARRSVPLVRIRLLALTLIWNMLPASSRSSQPLRGNDLCEAILHAATSLTRLGRNVGRIHVPAIVW